MSYMPLAIDETAECIDMKERLAEGLPNRYAYWSKQTKQVHTKRLGRTHLSITEHICVQNCFLIFPRIRLPRVFAAVSPAQRLLQPQASHVRLV